ncbi:hypothetical protein E4T56_gene20737 [Termitomyces sp. T112]|nr:hypothetical protein E4T56_gene20737 [Termitomyces sp. T112]
MASRINPEDLCNNQQSLTKSSGPPEDQRFDSSSALSAQPALTIPISQATRLESPENNVENQQASAWAKPIPNPSNNQNTPPESTQSATRCIQESPPQDASFRVPEVIRAPTTVDARSRVRQDTRFPAPGTMHILNSSSMQPSNSGNVQLATREDMQFRCPEVSQSLALSNGRAAFDRSLPSNLGYGGPEELRAPPQAKTVAAGSDGPQGSTSLDWIVPLEDGCQTNRTTTVSERLQSTLSKAHSERNKFAIKAKMTGWTLNVAIFIQVILGSLTTGVSAGAANEKQAAIGTAILGALSTIVASFLARARGSGEPELSATRVKDLEQYIREVDAFLMDHGNSTSSEHDIQLHKFRMRFEELLGNMTHKSARGPPESEASKV